MPHEEYSLPQKGPVIDHDAERMTWQEPQGVVSRAENKKAQYKGILRSHQNSPQHEHLTGPGCLNPVEGIRNPAVAGEVSHEGSHSNSGVGTRVSETAHRSGEVGQICVTRNILHQGVKPQAAVSNMSDDSDGSSSVKSMMYGTRFSI